MAPLTKSALAALLACTALLAPSSVSAALTKFDTEFDGKAVFLVSSLGTIGEVTAAQKDEWLTKLFNEAKAKVDAGIADGTMTVGAYVRIIDAFYTTADTKYRNFASVASNNISDGKVDLASYDPAVGASWCDFVFDTMRELAKGKADVLAFVDAENKKFEGFVTGKTGKAEIDAAFLEFLKKVNGMDATIIDKFDDKVSALAEKITTEKKSIASTKETDSVTTTAPPTTKPTTTTETTEAPATTTASPVSIGDKNTTEEATTAPAAASKNSSTTAPTPAPTPKSGAGQLMTSVVAVLSSVAVALAVSVW